MGRKKKTHLMFLLLVLLCVGAAQTENCPSDPDIARTDLSCESDYNRTITCVWNSTSASDLPDNVCTLKASLTSKYVNYNAKCKLEPVDVSRPTLRKCTLIFNRDIIFQSFHNLSMNLNCNPGNQTLKVYFKPACHIKLNPPPQPRINFTTASWFPQVVYNPRFDGDTFSCQLQWKHQNQSCSESNVLDTSCKRDCSVELNLDELKQGERYEARVRAKTSGNDFKSMWSDWSPTASWVSPVGGTKEPPPARTDLSCESDFNRTITCVWNSTSASDLPDNVCTLKASKTSKYVNYNTKCKLEPVDVSRPTLRKCTLIFNTDSRFASYDNLSMDLNCNPGEQTLKVYFKPACHIKLNPPPQPRINFTTVSWSSQVVYNPRFDGDTFSCQLQWKHQDQSWSESNVLDTSCKLDCSVELNLDELIQDERYEARVRAKISGNDYKSMWSDWSPTASWVSPIGGTKEPPPPPPPDKVMLRRSSRLTNAGYYNLRGEPVISYKETSTYRRPKRVAPDSRKDTTKKMVRFVPEAKEAKEANEASRNSRNSIDHWLFYMLFVCLGIVNFTLALSMNGNSLDTVLSRTEGLEEQVIMLQNEMLKLKRINELPPWDSMPNFALESQGARLLAHLSSNTYESTKPSFFIPIWKFLTPFWRPAADPSIVTQGGPIMVGRCWPFHGERGHLVIALSHPVTISHVTLGHISKTVSPNDKILSAPKMFAVYGMKTKEDEGTLLGTFLYDQDGESVQTFELSDQEEGVFSHVKLQVESNWGNPDYTCVYNFRVHGTV